jgi:hypothetical protein
MSGPRVGTIGGIFVLLLGAAGGALCESAPPSLTLQWLGWDADRVGKDPQPQLPDGAPDHRLQLRLKPAPPQEIRAIELLEADDLGGPAEDGLRWSTGDAGAEYLAVEKDGHRLNRERAATLGAHAGDVLFDLYAHDFGQWPLHTSIVAAVVLPDGRRIERTVTLQPPPDRLLGVWQMHCPSRSPQAFEPMTMSGRLQLVWQPDGSITGFFGVLPVRGKVDASGHVEGIAEDPTGRAVWQGELERPQRGRPLRGTGSFELERTRDACVGSGAWSSR